MSGGIDVGGMGTGVGMWGLLSTVDRELHCMWWCIRFWWAWPWIGWCSLGSRGWCSDVWSCSRMLCWV
jgi:hypothetical protein